MRIRRYRESDHDEVWALHNLALEGTGAHAAIPVAEDLLYSHRAVDGANIERGRPPVPGG